MKNFKKSFGEESLVSFIAYLLIGVVVATTPLDVAAQQEEYWHTRVEQPELPKLFSTAVEACSNAAVYSGGLYGGITHWVRNYYNCFKVPLEGGAPRGFATLFRGTCPPNHTFSGSSCIKETKNSGVSCNNTSGPINVFSGNKHYSYVDYSDKDFLISRSYNTSTKSWSFNYLQHLRLSPLFLGLSEEGGYSGPLYSTTSGKINAQRPDGTVLQFSYGEGILGYSSPSHRKERLVLIDNQYNTIVENYGDYSALPPVIAHTHTFYSQRDNFEKYDSAGRLIEIGRVGREPISLSYNFDHNEKPWPSAINLHNGSRSLAIQFDSNYRRVSEIILPDTTRIRYEYLPVTDNSNQVVSRVIQIAPDNEPAVIFQHFYEDTRFPTYITGIIDGSGNRISSVIYDPQGRAISSEKGPLNSGIERTQIQYNADESRTLTNALGKQSTYHFTQFNGEYKVTQVEGHQSANCAAANKNYTYHTSGLLETKTDWKNNTTSYQYNTRNLESSRTEALGTPQERTITTEWHPTFNLRTKITELGRETNFIYDAEGRLLSQSSNELPLS